MIVVITGASSGIGLATAKFLANRGFKVYGFSRTEVKGENFESVVCDMTDFDAVKTKLNYIAEKEGKIDALINNAGMGIAGAIEHTTEADLRKIFELNVFAMINSCKCITAIMRAGGGGKIINIGSVAGVIPIPFQTCYSVTKSAVDMFTMSYGLEVKDFGIQTTCVMPGDTKTGFTDHRKKNELLEDEHYSKRIQESIAKMEKDEREGKSPETVSKVILKVLNKKKAPSRVTVGGTYKLIVFLSKILPRRLMLKVIKKMYG